MSRVLALIMSFRIVDLKPVLAVVRPFLLSLCVLYSVSAVAIDSVLIAKLIAERINDTRNINDIGDIGLIDSLLLKTIKTESLHDIEVVSAEAAQKITQDFVEERQDDLVQTASKDVDMQAMVPVTSFANIVEPLMPAVVNIYTVQYKKTQQLQKIPIPEGFPFNHFHDFFEQFNTPFNSDEMYSDPKAVSLGSGFVIDSSGFIVTNHHVVNNADEINVKLIDNTELPAKLIGSDQRTDLALLKVMPKQPLPFVKFGDSSKARVGDWLIAIGNPFGLGGTVTTGIISSKGRDIDINMGGIVDDFIQTDAAINSGNSGGPMFNMTGEVIGVSTAIFSPSGTNIGIGFAIPSNTVQSIVDQLKRNGKISRGKLDITIQEVTAEIAEGLGLKEATGALVAEVITHGAADKAGIKAGDVIIEFAGSPVKNSRKLQVMVAEAPVDKAVQIAVIRGGKVLNLKAKITEGDSASRSVNVSKTKEDAENITPGSIEKNNITFTDLSDDLCRKFGIKLGSQGIVVTAIEKVSKNYGLKLGDLVVAVNQQRVNNIEELKEHFDKAKTAKRQHIVILVKRRNIDIFIAIPIQ